MERKSNSSLPSEKLKRRNSSKASIKLNDKLKSPKSGSSALSPPQSSSSDPPAATDQVMTKDSIFIGIPDTLPAGAMPIFLASASIDIFQLKQGEHLTEERPYKFISKDDVLADLFNRAAVSDLSVVKPQMQQYAEDRILVIHDASWKFGQNYIICTTIEAKDFFFQKSDPAGLDQNSIISTSKTAISQAKRPERWVSLGSEKDIEDERVLATRDLVHIQVSRRRRKFGQPCKFSDKDAQDCTIECKQFKDTTVKPIHRADHSVGLQVLLPAVDASVQTTWHRPMNVALQYEPITLAEDQKEQIWQSEEMSEFMNAVDQRIEKALQQNAIMNIFQNNFTLLGDEDTTFEQGSTVSLIEYQSFTDLRHSKDKSISCVAWHPTQKGILAVSVTQRYTFDERVDRGFNVKSKQSLILIWSFYDPIHPQLILEAPDDVTAFQFNPHDPNIIVGGCINGQIVLWDTSEYQDRVRSTKKQAKADDNSKDNKDTKDAKNDITIIKYIAVSSIEYSHRNAITDLSWLPKHLEVNHNGETVESKELAVKQLVTSALDGQIFFWDLRFKKDLKSLDLVWKPLFKVPMMSGDNTFDYGITKISLKPFQVEKDDERKEKGNKERENNETKEKTKSNLATKFFAATEEGDLAYADWMGVEKADKDAPASRIEHVWGVHFAPMTDVQRSPFFPDIVLSVGGWSFHIWKEKVTAGSLLSSSLSNVHLAGSCWSTTRPGVFFISKADGVIEVWDLLDKSHVPTLVQTVSATSITHMALHTSFIKSNIHHQFLGVGDDEGTLHVLEVPKALRRPSRNEKQLIKAFFEREVKRVGNVVEQKANRAKENTTQDVLASTTAVDIPQEPKASSDSMEKELEVMEKQYQEIEKALLEKLSIAASAEKHTE